MINEQTCGTCQKFQRDIIGFGQGIGYCTVYQDYLAKNPSEKAKEAAFKALGGKVCYLDIPRKCSKFLGFDANTEA